MDLPNLQQMVWGWVLLMAILVFVRRRWKMPGTGLTFAYLLSLSLIHLVGAAIYSFPAYQSRDPRFTTMGFEQALYGVAAFAVGGLLIAPLLIRKGLLPRASGGHEADPRLPKAYIAAGIVFYILSSSFLRHIPTASAIIASGSQLVLVGFALSCWKAWREWDWRKLLFWLAASLLMPAVTLATQGFLGFGAVAVLTLLIFVSSLVQSSWKITLAGALVIYVGLSVFVSYMRDRDEIRASVWGQQSLSDRIDRLMDTAFSIEPFDPENLDHLKRVEGRLNQNNLVGVAVYQLSQNQNFAHGDTLWDALLALIPRAIWPEKPIRAGSGNLVTRFTGIDFSEGTSVGIGQVLEFYANFGTIGVVVGFLIMGVIVTVFDWQAAERLARSDLHGFVLWFLPGIALLQVGGQLVEVTASAAASLIVAVLVNRYLYRLQKRQSNAPAAPVPVLQGLRVP
ncbi:MAG: hypothetical protein ABSH50_18930 [Bryobacteraceae bacterium]|jgi:hypothetical protein